MHTSGVPPVEEPSPLLRDPPAVCVTFAYVISLPLASLLLHSCHPAPLLCHRRRGKRVREPAQGPDQALRCRASAEEEGEEDAVACMASIPSLPLPALAVRARSQLPSTRRCSLLEAVALHNSKASRALLLMPGEAVLVSSACEGVAETIPERLVQSACAEQRGHGPGQPGARLGGTRPLPTPGQHSSSLARGATRTASAQLCGCPDRGKFKAFKGETLQVHMGNPSSLAGENPGD